MGRGYVGNSASGQRTTERAGVPRPKILVTADDVVNGKPHPEPYLKGAELLGVNPAECLVIEDAPAGIRSAHAGGMKVIGLTSTYPAAHWPKLILSFQGLRNSSRAGWHAEPDGHSRVECCGSVHAFELAQPVFQFNSSSVFSSRYFTITGVYKRDS